MTFYQKIGGIHWFSIGRFRVAFCRVKPKPTQLQPIAKWEARLERVYRPLPRTDNTSNLLNW